MPRHPTARPATDGAPGARLSLFGGFAQALGWLAQIGLFVILGLLVSPHSLALLWALVLGGASLALAGLCVLAVPRLAAQEARA